MPEQRRRRVEVVGRCVLRVARVGDRSHDEAVAGQGLGQVPEAQAAIVAISSNDGAIEAMTGGFDLRLKMSIK